MGKYLSGQIGALQLSLTRVLNLLSRNSFAQTIQGSSTDGRKFYEAIIRAAKEQKSRIGNGRTRDYRVADEALMLAQFAIRDLDDAHALAQLEDKSHLPYLSNAKLAELAIALSRSDRLFSTDAEPSTFLEEGGLAVMVAGHGSDTRVMIHAGLPSGFRTQYDSGGY